LSAITINKTITSDLKESEVMVLLIVMADNHSLVFEVRGDGFIDSDG
jgi:hypothetical protein